MQSILPYLVSALLYAAMAAYFWRLHWSPAAQDLSPSRGVTERACVLATLTVHGLVLFGVMFADHTLRIGVGDAISAILWLTVLIYWLGSLFYRLEGLQALILPVAAVAAFLPAVLPAAKPLPNTDMLAFKLHLVMSMAAYSLFTIASLHVLLMAMLAACGKPEEAAAPVVTPAKIPSLTAVDADKFVAEVTDDLRKKLPYLSAAQWVQSTYITDDTELLSSAANEQWMEYLRKKIEDAKKFKACAALIELAGNIT